MSRRLPSSAAEIGGRSPGTVESRDCLRSVSFGDAYVLKSYIRLEVLPNLDESLAAARAAVQHAPQIPTRTTRPGLVLEKKGQPEGSRAGHAAGVSCQSCHTDVYFRLEPSMPDQLHEPQKSVDAFPSLSRLGQSERAVRAVQECASRRATRFSTESLTRHTRRF